VPWGATIYFFDKSGVGGVSFPAIQYLQVTLPLKLGNTGWYFTLYKSQIQSSHFSQA